MKIRNFLIIYPLFFTPLSSSSVFAADILPGSSLYASNENQKWSSPSNTFSLLFLPITPSTFSLCIAYGGSVSIWEPAGKTDGNSSFHFLSDGNLRLINGSGEVLWQSNTAHLGITHATLEDSGNFVLKNGSVSLWHSFEHLTDTLVPSQKLTVSSVLTSGLYTLSLGKSGNLTLKWKKNILYWNYGVLNNSVISNLTNPSLSIRQNGILSLYDPKLSSPVNMAYSSDFDDGNEFRFLKLESDGNVRIYGVVSGTTTIRWTGISDQCEVFGYCGNLGICTYNVTGSPTCSCPSQNFLFVDPSDSRKGCKRKVEMKDCAGNETVLSMNNTRFLTFPPEASTDQYVLGTTACRFNCLSSSSCIASSVMADGTGYCYIKTSSIVSGYQSPTIPGSSFVKVCGPIVPNPPLALEGLGKSTSWKLHAWIIVVLASLGTLVGLFILGGVIWCLYLRNNPKFGGFSPQYALLEYASGTPVQLSYKELKKVTKGFKEKLGAGGFGAVYKGSLYNNMAVAVKQLEGIEQGEKQFRMEVATISSTHHLNLVRLIGFCSEGRHRLLVYEFMKNGSLDKSLFQGKDHQSLNLNWEQRFNIAVGTARGITYLHEECRDCIVHCDIKPENILLDDNLNAKVSDFGLAKLIHQKEQKTRNLTTLRGTRGYLGPEWLANLPITSKSDVYSFGMVLLEIVSGRRNFEASVDTNMVKFSLWAYEELEKGNVMNIVDNRLGEEFDMEQARRALLVAFWCIQQQPSLRPRMGKVVQMLERVIPVENPPSLKTNEEDLCTSICVGNSIDASSSVQQSVGSNFERPSSSLLQEETDLNR